jgi:glycosyltransferase involved in cell wall biosynthesis
MISSFLLGLKVKEVDLVWGTSPPIFQGITAWGLARIKRVPFLLEIRDLWPLFAVGVGVLKNPILIGASEWLERTLYHRAEAVLINSPGFFDHVRSRGARRVELIPNGSDPAMFDPRKDGAAFRSEHRLTGKFVVLYAGAHGISNDLEVVLDSAALISEARIQIVLLGDGKEKRNLQDRAKELGLTNLIFLPPIPKSMIPEALAAADACLAILKPLPEYKTTYPNKVFDYMAAGRPVILAIDGVIRGVIDDAGCGIFVEPGDQASLAKAIDQLAVDPARGRKMGLAGREYLENHFSRAKIGKRLIQFLEELQ